MQYKIVIVGLGFVGQANALALIKQGFDIHGYDKGKVKNIYKDKDFKKIKIIKEVPDDCVCVVCVNAKNTKNGNQDLTSVKNVLNNIKKKKNVFVVLRTSLLPVDVRKFKNKIDIYLPEFLHERLAVKECLRPKKIIIGKDKERKVNYPEFLKKWIEIADEVYKTSIEEACLVKYLENHWNALRIAFVNEYGDLIRNEKNVDFKRVLRIVLKDAPYLVYGKEFGGNCLPKDTEAFVSKYNSKILKAALETNTKHKKMIEKRYPNQKRVYYGDKK